MTTPGYKYIEAAELVEKLKERETNPHAVAIVDVRDDDFDGGNIVGARNVPSSVFSNRVLDVADELRSYEHVVFHCALSQQRGPKAARIYSEIREAALTNGRWPDDGMTAGDQEVLVLRDGFVGFGPRYKDDKNLVENWKSDAGIWF
ncbi:protein-tyrosine-phosphatase [Malassezia cuniculi]|uniref:Protein-tyrosine-phosphatase n=1 Tax=Malassezia cuniculi TaxID=948313 RepID=A0AAF0EYZ8_9BASI|nr:protein-tyrosine-phosphatase [Malassezia cuniculi]